LIRDGSQKRAVTRTAAIGVIQMQQNTRNIGDTSVTLALTVSLRSPRRLHRPSPIARFAPLILMQAGLYIGRAFASEVAGPAELRCPVAA
jgi:hypothetical protein